MKLNIILIKYFLVSLLLNNSHYTTNNKLLYLIGDWGLGIGDLAQSPIPNPQSPISLLIDYSYN